MSDQPVGPYKFKSIIPDDVNNGTNHRSIIEYTCKWYLCCHTAGLAIRNIPADSEAFKYIR